MADGKTLYLMRHAEAAWMGAGQRDFDRPLDPKGKHDAEEMSQRLNVQTILPSVILSSPALRAAQTAETIAAKLGIPADSIIFIKEIYEAGTANLLEIIQSLDNSHTSAMLVGHNPALTWLINHLTGEHIANAPTSTIATLRTFSTRWEDTASTTANLLDFDYPGNLRDVNTRPV